MASPAGHTLLAANAVLLTQLVLQHKNKQFAPVGLKLPAAKTYNRFSVADILTAALLEWLFWLYIILMANAPDLDFVAGLLNGDMNMYHHKISHSVGFAILIYGGLLILCKLSGLKRLFADFGLLAYLSHLLGDFIAEDGTQPYGAMFLWPLTSDYFIAPFYVFMRIEHGDPGDTMHTVIERLTLPHNFMAVATELMLFIPLFYLAHRLLKSDGRHNAFTQTREKKNHAAK